MGKKKKIKRKVEEDHESNHDQANGSTETAQTKYTIEDLLERVAQYVENFEFDLALKFCEKALQIDPGNVNVLETSGNVCAEIGDVENSKTYFQKAIELQPDEGHVKYLYLGQLSEGHEAVGYYESALRLMKEKQEHDMNNLLSNNNTEDATINKKDISSVYCSLAEIYMTDCCMDENAEETCEKYCQHAIESDEHNTDAYIVMCNFLLSKNDMEAAKNTAEKAFDFWSKTSEISEDSIPEIISYGSRITLIKILIEVESYDKVSVIVDQLIDENEDDIRIWYYLGLSKSLLKDSDNPRFYLEKALELFEKTGCEDEDMKAHIEELLEDCPEESEENMETIKEADESDEDCDNINMEEG